MKTVIASFISFFMLFVISGVTGNPALAAEVILDGYSFKPEKIEIKAGETVKWINRATLAHTITSGEDCKKNAVWDSGYLLPEKMKPEKSTFERKFDKPGTYKYYCKPHCKGEGMTGTVVVKP